MARCAVSRALFAASTDVLVGGDARQCKQVAGRGGLAGPPLASPVRGVIDKELISALRWTHQRRRIMPASSFGRTALATSAAIGLLSLISCFGGDAANQAGDD